MIDATGRLLGRFNVIDVTLIAFLLTIALGLIAVQSGWHQTSGQVIEGESDIVYAIHLRNVKALRPKELFHVGDVVSMTVRNQPRGKVAVERVVVKPKQAIIPTGGGGVRLMPDPDDQYGYDYLVTLRDHAIITEDGYVTSGVKIKTGMKILVEGPAFQLAGVIADVRKAPPQASPNPPAPAPAKSPAAPKAR